ncbi:hypothetical protein APHAL10511_005864 [Amanita phalloides]|nr:hypothetical protein APHAL10511_005864 [Amanita phalloides]
MSYQVFCMGNPLLDMQVVNREDLLKKYDLKPNDAILAAEKHAPLYDEVSKEHNVTYLAGGAAQNTARAAAYVLPPCSVVYTGCVGNDDLAEQLKSANKKEGVDNLYLVKEGEKTGACAAIITGHHRSLVTTLRAAEMFDKAHLSSPAVTSAIDSAKLFYVGGFFLTHGTPSVVELGQKASAAGKTFVLNLSAPFIAQFFTVNLQQVLTYCDIIICNETEAESWAAASGLPNTKDVAEIAKAIALLPKTNASRPRTVIVTQGENPTVLVTSSEPDIPRIYQVEKLDSSKIVDTNGAGDAFAGAFIGACVLGKDIGECVLAGHALAAICVQQVGPQYKWPKVQII